MTEDTFVRCNKVAQKVISLAIGITAFVQIRCEVSQEDIFVRSSDSDATKWHKKYSLAIGITAFVQIRCEVSQGVLTQGC